MLEDLQALYKALEDDHNNWGLWGLLGDCYEDMGSELAKGIRWMCENQKRPYRYHTPDYSDWTVYNQDAINNGIDTASNFPAEIWQQIQLPTDEPVTIIKVGTTLQETVEAVCNAICKTLNNKVHSGQPSR